MTSVAKKLDKDFKYFDIPKHKIKNGWIRMDEYLPEEFELVSIKEKTSDTSRPGWYTGHVWAGYTVNPKNPYYQWKKYKR